MQETKRYLNQAYRLNELIQSDKDELNDLEQLKDSIPGIDYSKDKVQVSPTNEASYAKIIAKIDNLVRVIHTDIENLLDLKLEIRTVISNVNKNAHRLVLQLRYLNFYKWNKIAEVMNVSERTAIRIHDDAIRKVKVPEK